MVLNAVISRLTVYKYSRSITSTVSPPLNMSISLHLNTPMCYCIDCDLSNGRSGVCVEKEAVHHFMNIVYCLPSSMMGQGLVGLVMSVQSDPNSLLIILYCISLKPFLFPSRKPSKNLVRKQFLPLGVNWVSTKLPTWHIGTRQRDPFRSLQSSQDWSLLWMTEINQTKCRDP